MNGLFQRLKDWWEAADRTQKLVTGFGAAFLAVLLVATVTLAGQPKMQPVFTGLSDTEKGSVYDELTKKGFKAEISAQGEITVPSQDVQRAKMALASSGKLPKGTGATAAAAGGFLDTPAVEQTKLRSQLEGELAASIMTLSGVSSATVHIAPGKDSAVMDEKVPPTAVVNVSESSEGALTQDEGKSIANLVQYSVTGMTSSGVKVVTNSGKTIFDGAELNSDEALASNKMEAERAEARRRQNKLQSELDQILGKGNSLVDVDVTLNMDPTTEQTEKVTPSDKPMVVEKGDEKMNGAGNGASGVAGLETNTPAQPASPAGAADAGKYANKVISERYGSNTVRTEVKKSMGNLVGMAISVTCNKTALTDEKSNAIEDRVNAALGANAGQPGFVAHVIPVEFSTTLAETEKKMQSDAAASQRMQQMISLLPVAALLLVGFMLMKAIGKSVGPGTQLAALAGGQRIALPVGGDPGAMHVVRPDGTLAPANHGAASLPGGASAPADPVAAALADEDALERARHRDALLALGIDDDDDNFDVRSIRQKIDVPLEQIKKMAEKKPEIFAMLIKSWMAEDRR